MNRYLVVFMGILTLEIVLCTMQKYLFLSNLGNILNLEIDLCSNKI
jgi:hypothetical protein